MTCLHVCLLPHNEGDGVLEDDVPSFLSFRATIITSCRSGVVASNICRENIVVLV